MIRSSQLSAPQQKRFGEDRNVRLTLSSYQLSIPPSEEAAQASTQAIRIGGLPVRQGPDMGAEVAAPYGMGRGGRLRVPPTEINLQEKYLVLSECYTFYLSRI